MLILKMLRDIKENLMQFIAIFLMAFLGVFVFSGISAEWYGIKNVLNSYIEDTNLADIWIYGDNFSKDDINKLNEIEGVNEVERRVYLEGVGIGEKEPKLFIHFLEENIINKPLVVEGREFDINDAESIWVDKNYAKANKLKLGENLSFSSNGFTLTKKIAGFVESSEYIYYSNDEDLWPDYSKIGYVYLSVKSLPNEDLVPYTSIIIKSEMKDTDKIEEDIKDKLDNKNITFISRDNFPKVKAIFNEIEQHQVMGNIFPVAFIAIALLAIVTTMTRLVNNQRTIIGTLKALGFKRRKILYHYISYGFWISLTGSVLGAVAGNFTLPYLFYPSMSSFYSLPKWQPKIAPITIFVTFISIMLCTFVTYLSCNNLLRDTPAETLRPKAPKKVKRSAFEKSKLWRKLSFNIQWNLRDITRAKSRTIMGFLGTMSCMALLVCAFSEYDTMKYMKKWLYGEINQFETQINFNDIATIEDKQKIAKDVDGQLVMSSSIEIKVNGEKKVGTLTVIENDDLYKVMSKELKEIDLLNGEIALSSRMAEELKIKEGDTIKWHLYGEESWKESKVNVLNRVPISQGITMTKETLESYKYEFNPSSVITLNHVDNYENDFIASTFTIDELKKSWDKSMEAMNMIVYVLVIAASLLALVVLYNLGLLSFTEKERELATLKVVGFKSKNIRKLLLTQNIWLALLGVVAGLPIGIWLLYIMCITSGEDFDFTIKMSILSFITCSIMTIGISVVVNLMFSKKIKGIDMVGALKGVE